MMCESLNEAFWPAAFLIRPSATFFRREKDMFEITNNSLVASVRGVL